MSGLDELRDQYHRSVEAFIRGDPEPAKITYSHQDDATLANPLGPPAKGWHRVSQVLDSAASLSRDGEGLTWEIISSYEATDLGYEVAIQRCRVKIGGAAELVPVALRVTTIFRREDDGWKVVHRHADPITDARPIQSVMQRSGDGS